MGRVQQARQVLRKHFGFDDFRDAQQQVVSSILERRDTLVIMPTGGGKSLCYQLPALMMDGVTLVVSPLIALMKDQVDALRARGIPAGMINSSQNWEEQKEVLDLMRRDEIKLVYVSPERFRAASFTRSLETTRIAMLAIDEAHCISQWGHDFRPDYMRLGSVVEQLGRPLCSAFTATATPDVREDIQRQLGLREPSVFVSGFARDNLSFNVSEIDRKIDKSVRLRELIDAYGTGIIYCATRKSVEAVSAELREDGIAHCAYHAGLSNSEREAAQERFMRREVPVAVATSAFGMGIDRADIRFVCHYEMPGSVEAFYQEAGRAGRDGKPAYCELLFMYADKRVQDFFVEGANPEVRKIREVYDFIRSRCNDQHEMFLPVDEITEALPGRNNPMAVHTAIGHLVRRGYLERFDVPGEQLRGTRLLKPEVDARGLELPEADLLEKRRRDLDKLKAVVQMAYAKECRQSWILRYFGEPVEKDCGRCDQCSRESVARTLLPDEFVILQKALSGVARMSYRHSRYEWQPRYGRTKIMHCLLGKNDARLTQSGLDELPTFGILQELGAKFISRLFEAMEEAGLVEIEQGEYPLLRLTESGARVMFGEDEVALDWPEAARPAPSRKKKAAVASPDDVQDRELYRKLVALRDRMRRARGNAPAYTIFPNAVLAQLADLKPADADAAMQVKGIGPAKAESILPAFLELIAGREPEEV
ncbi:ATP-dependent DNA helicase RecQ [Ruficoccus amylovorans]|uniref:ATP-dependent DNA helicase RecQ n=1 Tax=Ruficoccus amylovorans TaxID=1804625 RepID=A0A842HBX8_9BACT|nr:ATP-dependent DNA helicase RecQ [Ruficoccus amylovorans]MBC2592921.1 ATP-dependent DNA helicase RecQ [Ruficoccus amylovorans]